MPYRHFLFCGQGRLHALYEWLSGAMHSLLPTVSALDQQIFLLRAALAYGVFTIMALILS